MFRPDKPAASPKRYELHILREFLASKADADWLEQCRPVRSGIGCAIPLENQVPKTASFLMCLQLGAGDTGDSEFTVKQNSILSSFHADSQCLPFPLGPILDTALLQGRLAAL